MSLDMNSLNRATASMTRSFAVAGDQMSRSLERISSGKRFTRASDDFSGFQKVLNLSLDQTKFERQKVGLSELGAELQEAIDASDSVMEDLVNMKAAWADAEAAAGGSPEEDAAKDLAAGYQASIIEALKTKTSSDKKLIDGTSASWGTATMAGGSTLTVDLSGETVTTGAEATAAATQTSIDNMVSYIGKLKEYQATADSQTNLTDVMINSSKLVSSTITEIDEAEEMANYIDADIRQQAAISMMSQANLSRRNISGLYS